MKTKKRSRTGSRSARWLSTTILSLAVILSPCAVSGKPERTVRAATVLSNPTTNADGVTTWDCVYFGKYWQNDTNGNGVADQNDEKEPIKWRVLSVNGDDAFLLADQSLDAQPYNYNNDDVTWETCTLRCWLNSDFLNNAFDSSEQAAIKDTTVVNEDNPIYGTEGGNDTTDKVYLLSIAEAYNTAYGFNGDIDTYSKTRVSTNTAYVARNPVMGSQGMAGWWWLRSVGCSSWEFSTVCGVSDGLGDYNGYNVCFGLRVIRPVLHLNLNASSDAIPSSLWTYAGWVTSEGEKGVSHHEVADLPTSTGGTSEPSGSSSSSSLLFAPGKVIITSAKRKKGGEIILKYKKISSAKGYQIQYSAKKNFKGKKSKVISGTKYMIKKWKKKKTCYIRVRAYNLNKGKKLYGKWSKVKKVA